MPLSQIACLGLSHQSAPLELRERVTHALVQEEHLCPADLPAPLAAISEVVLLTTCNRIELYAAVNPDVPDARQLLVDYLDLHHSAPALHDCLIFRSGEAAAQHLLRVASGLESQILGETEILGQVTGAFMQATGAGTIGPLLTTLFRAAIRAGKRARAETAISRNPLSVASAAIALADRRLGTLQHRSVLIVGLGQMGQLALSALRQRAVTRIALANRDVERANRLRRSPQELVFSLENLPRAIIAADVMFTATASPGYLIDRRTVAQAMEARAGRELVIVDIALPRDVDPHAAELPGVRLFNMDDVRPSLDAAAAARRSEAPRVEAIIASEMTRLQAACNELAVRPLIAEFRSRAEEIRQYELQRSVRRLGGDVDPDTLQQMQHLSRSLVNKLLHEPTVRMRAQANNGAAERLSEALRELFALDEVDTDGDHE